MSDFEKAQKNLKNDMLVLFILKLIIIVFSFFTDGLSSILAIPIAILLYLGYKFAKSGKKDAGTIGIITGILMMITIIQLDILDFVLGLFVLLHSTKYNKLVK